MVPALRRELDRRQRPLVVAHRGDSGRFPENTLPAFEAAVALGVDLVELDFHATADGVLVCLHDDTLARTAGDARAIANVPVRELDSTRVPTLEAALEVITPGSLAATEHKAGDARAFVDLVTRMRLVESVLAMSFDWGWLEAVHVLEPRIALAALGGDRARPRVTDAMFVELERTGACAVNWNHELLRDDDVRVLREHGSLVLIYTADEPRDYERLVRIGVDAITTNEPGRLLAFRAARRELVELVEARPPDGLDRLAAAWQVHYGDLQAIADGLIAREGPNNSLEPTELVHEAYVRLFGQANVAAHGTTFFRGCFARECRRILVDRARRRSRARHGGDHRRTCFRDSQLAIASTPDLDLLDVDEALRTLERENERMARVVEMRLFAGLTVAECADVLGVSPRTVDHDWKLGREFVRRLLG